MIKKLNLNIDKVFFVLLSLLFILTIQIFDVYKGKTDQKTKDMIEDVAYSRCYMGVHYQTDNDFAFQVGKMILQEPEFVKKYGI